MCTPNLFGLQPFTKLATEFLITTMYIEPHQPNVSDYILDYKTEKNKRHNLALKQHLKFCLWALSSMSYFSHKNSKEITKSQIFSKLIFPREFQTNGRRKRIKGGNTKKEKSLCSYHLCSKFQPCLSRLLRPTN